MGILSLFVYSKTLTDTVWTKTLSGKTSPALLMSSVGDRNVHGGIYSSSNITLALLIIFPEYYLEAISRTWLSSRTAVQLKSQSHTYCRKPLHTAASAQESTCICFLHSPVNESSSLDFRLNG